KLVVTLGPSSPVPISRRWTPRVGSVSSRVCGSTPGSRTPTRWQWSESSIGSRSGTCRRSKRSRPPPTPPTARARRSPASDAHNQSRLTLDHRQPPGNQGKAPDSARFLLVPAPGGLTMTQRPDRNRREPGYHRPVLASEVAEVFRPLPAGVVVDATFGGGGHTRRLLETMEHGTRIIGIDRDPDALTHAGLAGDDRVTLIQGNFGRLAELLESVGADSPVGVLFDLGVSSHQLDEAERGFSYRHDGPLDMRMGPDAPFTAAEVVNEWERNRLASVIRRY